MRIDKKADSGPRLGGGDNLNPGRAADGPARALIEIGLLPSYLFFLPKHGARDDLMADEPRAPLSITHEPQRSLSLRLRQWWNGFCASPFAQNRSIQLLKENLSAAQRQQYERHHYFEVIGGSTGTRYRIHHGYQMNVQQLDRRGMRVRMLCFMPEGRLRVGDIMLAQKLALELFEDDAVKAANKVLPDPARFRCP